MFFAFAKLANKILMIRIIREREVQCLATDGGEWDNNSRTFTWEKGELAKNETFSPTFNVKHKNKLDHSARVASALKRPPTRVYSATAVLWYE